MENKIYGVWRLKSFTNILPNGERKIWDGNFHGHIIYTKEKVVSVAINRSKTLESGETIQKNSFYTGNFELLKNNTVEHFVTESSVSKLIGQTYTRFYKIKNDVLIINGVGLTGNIEIEWQKA